MNQPSTIDLEPDNQPLRTSTLANILKEVSLFQENSCLQVVYNSTTFFLHFNKGKLIYGTNCLAPFERLERHLRRLSNQNSKLTNQVIGQARLKFRNDLEYYAQSPSDYQGLLWLSEQNYLSPQEAETLLRRITREVFESLLCFPDTCQYKFIQKSQELPELCNFDLLVYIKQCQQRLQAWQAFSGKIWSSYQRPYLVAEATKPIASLNKEQNETIYKLLKGLNFRQISALIDRDELVVAKILYPSMLDKSIILRDPKSPFDQLPKLPQDKFFTSIPSKTDCKIADSGFQINSNSKQTVQFLEKSWNIACVDDSESILDNFKTYLDNNLFSTLAIHDSMNAFAELIEFNPNLILLDVDMPNLNGYELCALLRKHHEFKKVPIVMLGEEQGLINLTKFKLTGGTDKLTKPFNHIDLLNMIFKHLH